MLTNGCGGLRPEWAPGTPVLISDHINLTATSPIVGARFVDLTDLYSSRLRALCREVDPSLEEGVYVQLPGPHYETPAEIRMLQVLGADRMRMQFQAGEVRHPGQVGSMPRHHFTGRAAGREGDLDPLDEVGRALPAQHGPQLRRINPFRCQLGAGASLALRVLLADYPREAWEMDPAFHGLVSFWPGAKGRRREIGLDGADIGLGKLQFRVPQRLEFGLDLTRQLPRPANPKASLYEQARFKKSSRSASSKAPTRRSRSRSGRSTNTASA